MGERLSTEIFINRSKKLHKNKYKYDRVDYKNNRTKVEIYCNSCKEYFWQIASSHLRNKGCRKCGNNSKILSNNKPLTQEKLKNILKYNPETGIFIWLRDTKNKAKYGRVAGTKGGEYIRIGINRINYQAHILAFLYMEGYTPEHDIHHKDGNGCNNKWSNLEHLSRGCHVKTRKNISTNTSGVKGVTWHSPSKRWRAYIESDKKKKHLGMFNNFKDAVIARYLAEQGGQSPLCYEASPAKTYLIENNYEI